MPGRPAGDRRSSAVAGAGHDEHQRRLHRAEQARHVWPVEIRAMADRGHELVRRHPQLRRKGRVNCHVHCLRVIRAHRTCTPCRYGTFCGNDRTRTSPDRSRAERPDPAGRIAIRSSRFSSILEASRPSSEVEWPKPLRSGAITQRRPRTLAASRARFLARAESRPAGAADHGSVWVSTGVVLRTCEIQSRVTGGSSDAVVHAASRRRRGPQATNSPQPADKG